MAGGREQVNLDLEGMTCASCAARIEKRLNRMPGVQATVNFATETASVTIDPAAASAADLIASVEAAGYGARVREADQQHPTDGVPDALALLRNRLLVSIVLTVPVVLLAMIPWLQFTYWQWLSLTLAAPVVVWGGWPFHMAALKNARHGTATMDTLVSVGVLAAFGWSVWALFLGGAGSPGMTMDFSWMPGHDGMADIYLEVAAGVVTLILTGRYLEARAKRESGAALRALLALGAKDAAVVRDGIELRVPIDQLAVGDVFVVRPGETVAADGEVIEGSSAIDASMLTGESAPLEVGVGDDVSGGTVNVGGRIFVRAARVGSDTALARMAALVSAAQSGKAPVQRLADRVSGVFVPVVLVLAVVTLAGWLVAGAGLEFAMTAAVAVLIIACPCALGLATPTALLVGTGRAAQLGIIIKGPEILESTRTIDTIVLDKTGTITTGEMTVIDVWPSGAEDSIEILRDAAALEAASEHPIARAVERAAAQRSIEVPSVTDFEALAGVGVRGVVNGVPVEVARPESMAAHGLSLGPELDGRIAAGEADGRTTVAVAVGGRVRGLLVLADAVRPTSADAIARLRAQGLEPVLLTGDNAGIASRVAREVGIADDPEHVLAGVLPAEKLAAVQALQARGRVVAMAGDGVNDAAALVQADLGIAMGSGTDVAIEASDLTIVGSDLLAVPDAIALSRRTLRTIKGNLFWAFAYNVAAIPLAALGLLNPLIAAAAMGFSSVFVVTNSLRLRRFTPAAALPR